MYGDSLHALIRHQLIAAQREARRPKRHTWIKPPDVPSTAPRQFYRRMNALLSWCNAYGQ